MKDENKKLQSKLAEQELGTLKFWKENRIFEKSVEKPAPQGDFVFYEGPPTANGKPGIHHLEARAFKDAIPRYKTMRGFRVRRKGGWDTHGLPVELQVEKELRLKSKKEIETYGVEAFNKKCRESVWTYVKEWEEFTERTGYWVDLKRPFVTYKPYYIESVWNIVSKINERGLLYKDYKVVPWCPRCGTALSSHELAQGYEDVKDLAVTVKFQITSTKSQTNSKSQIPNEGKTYLLAWTTTPWTLPGNVALAVNKKVVYVLAESDHMRYIVGKERLAAVFKDVPYTILEEFSGEKLVGVEYEPLYPFLKDSLLQNPSTNQNSVLPLGKGELRGEGEKIKNAFKVYAADFVTTTDGTGIVHTAVMYGQDDFELGTKVGLPKHHLVNEDGTFKKEAGFLAGKFVRDEATAVEIIKDLANRPEGSLLFAKEKYAHSYPHCWRCHTPLIYYARDSWYIRMSDPRIKKALIAENEKINWEPSYIKDGRFGEWLRDVKDWAISRERYWGTPLPVWECASCGKREVIGSIPELAHKNKPRNRYFLMRHGEAENNVRGIISSKKENPHHLTEKGGEEASASANKLTREKVDTIFSSPFVRTRETAELAAGIIGFPKEKIIFDERLGEIDAGVYNNRPWAEHHALFGNDAERFSKGAPEGETWTDVKRRMMSFLEEVDVKYEGKTILIVSHDDPLFLLSAGARALSREEIVEEFHQPKDFLNLGAEKPLLFTPLPHNDEYELDLHRPYIDAVTFPCVCGSPMRRVKEVMDVWFDSGAMPFAQDADLRGEKSFEKFWKTIAYPADYISEAIDQTRGWFYTLHAIGALMGRGKAYKNVICLGHILDAEGKKMSKSLGNAVEPKAMIEKYGADALRFWMYSVNQPGEPKNFDEKTVDEIVKKVFNLLSNVLAFYLLYAHPSPVNSQMSNVKSSHILDQWILARLNQLIIEVTDGLEKYKLLEPARAIRDFIADVSQWYLRRSRERIKNGGEEGAAALATLRHVLLELSKLMAPFTPFFAEYVYKEVGGESESVHLDNWPQTKELSGTFFGVLKTIAKKKYATSEVILTMEEVRRIVSLALEQRAKANIKVRQPLSSLKLKSKIINLKSGFAELIQDEVNVKEVVFSARGGSAFGGDAEISEEVVLDTSLTPELKEEGDARELVRGLQDFRKDAGLTPSERVVLSVETDERGRAFLEKCRVEVSNIAHISEFVFESVSGGTAVSAGEYSFKVSVKK